MLIPLARARAAAGEVDAARADLERAVRTAERIGETDDEVSGYIELSELARRNGDLDGAWRLLEKARLVAEPSMQRLDMRLVAVRTFSKLGCVTEQQGDLAAAARWHGQAFGALSPDDLPFLPVNPILSEVVEGFAALAAARGDHVRAAELLGLAQTLRGYRDTASLEVARATAAGDRRDRRGRLRRRPRPRPGAHPGRRAGPGRLIAGQGATAPGPPAAAAAQTRRRYIRIATGKATTTMPAAQASVYMAWRPTGPPTVSPRTASARCGDRVDLDPGLQPARHACACWACRMLLPNTSGIMKMNAMPCTVSGEGATRPISTEIQQTAR